MNAPMHKIEKLHGRPAQESFERALFSACDFAGVDLAGLRFEDCVFADCRLSNARICGTVFNGVHFVRCPMEGLNFFEAYGLVMAVSFEVCALDFCSFHGLSLKKTLFKNCSMRGTVLTQADLTGACLERCDLSRAVFHKTRLDKADLSTSYHFVIDPDDNSLKKTRFSALNLAGLLEKYDLEIE